MSSPTLTVIASDILNKAYSLIGVKDANQDINSNQSIDGLRALNVMIKAWQSQGLHLWTKTQGICFLDVGKASYDLGPDCDPACKLDDFYQTTVVAAVEGSATLTVASTEGMVEPSGGGDGGDVLTVDPVTSIDGWSVVNVSPFTSDGSELTINSTATDSNINRVLFSELVIGTEYTLNVDATFDPFMPVLSITSNLVDSGDSVLASDTITSDGTMTAVFTATEETVILRVDAPYDPGGFGVSTCVLTKIELIGPAGDFVAGSKVGVELDDGTRQWSNLSTLDGGNIITLADVLTGDAAEDNTVFHYVDDIERPLNILDLRRTDNTGQSEIDSNKFSRQQYFAQTNKGTQGAQTNWYFSPQLTCARLYVWQSPSNVNNVVKFTYIRPLQTADSIDDVIDFPSEWKLPIQYSLAVLLGPMNQLPRDRLLHLKKVSDGMLYNLLGHDRENSSLNIQPDYRGM